MTPTTRTIAMVSALALACGLTTGCKKKGEDKAQAPTPGTGTGTGTAAGTATPPPTPAVQPLAGEALAKHYLAGWEAWNANDKAKFRALYANDAVSHWPDDAAMPERRGGDAIVDEAWNFRAAFPDAKATAKLVFVNGRTLAAVWQTNGTNTAAMKGPGGELPPTGKAIGLLMFHQATLNDANQIVDEWFLMDSNSLMTQLGLAPGPARPALAASAEPPMIVVSTGNDAEKNNLNVTQKGDEDFNKHDVAAVNDSWADDGVESDVAAPEDVVGKAKIAEGTTMFMSAFPDAKITRLSLWAAGDYVIGVSSFTGTNDGPLGPMPKTGKAMKLTIAEVTKLDGGKVKQLWRFWDSGSMAIQLGLVPPPGEGGPAAPPAR